MTRKLNSDELAAEMESLRDWRLKSDSRLERELRFKTFPEAISFMTRVAFEAERMDHHPDWSNSYNRVKIVLTTHDAGGITTKDIELARKIDQVDWT